MGDARGVGDGISGLTRRNRFDHGEPRFGGTFFCPIGPPTLSLLENREASGHKVFSQIALAVKRRRKALEVMVGFGVVTIPLALIFVWYHPSPEAVPATTVSALARASGGPDANALRTIYSVYGSPGCLTPKQLEAHVKYVERAAHVSADRARAQIAAFIDRSVPPLLWVRFSAHPNELNAWPGPPADHCANPQG